MRVFNLLTDTVLSYAASNNCTPKTAVIHAYCLEQGLILDFIAAFRSNNQAEFVATMPIFKGNKTIACGNWCAMLTGGV